MFFPPKSRFRIQSYFSAYIKLLFATIFNRLESGNKNLELEKERENLFTNIELKGKKRKIGKVISKRIYEFLYL